MPDGVLGDHAVRIDHVAVAVRDIAAALPLYRDVFGGTLAFGGDDVAAGIRTCQMAYDGGKLELIQPTRPDSYLAGYLDRHGEGFHHLTVIVADLEATLAAVHARGLETVDVDFASPYWAQGYIRPSSAQGALIQLVELYDDPGSPVDRFIDCTAEDITAGRVVWVDRVPHLRTDAPG